MRQTFRLFAAFAVLSALAAGSGCQTESGYKTLKTIGLTVDTGMAAYTDSVNQGRVPPETQAKVKAAYPKFYTAYHQAVDVLKVNVDSPAPPDVATAFSQLLGLIGPFIPKPTVPANPYPILK